MDTTSKASTANLEARRQPQPVSLFLSPVSFPSPTLQFSLPVNGCPVELYRDLGLSQCDGHGGRTHRPAAIFRVDLRLVVNLLPPGGTLTFIIILDGAETTSTTACCDGRLVESVTLTDTVTSRTLSLASCNVSRVLVQAKGAEDAPASSNRATVTILGIGGPFCVAGRVCTGRRCHGSSSTSSPRLCLPVSLAADPGSLAVFEGILPVNGPPVVVLRTRAPAVAVLLALRVRLNQQGIAVPLTVTLEVQNTCNRCATALTLVVPAGEFVPTPTEPVVALRDVVSLVLRTTSADSNVSISYRIFGLATAYCVACNDADDAQ